MTGFSLLFAINPGYIVILVDFSFHFKMVMKLGAKSHNSLRHFSKIPYFHQFVY